MQLSLAFHIIGLVMWLGGLMIITRVLKLFTVGSQSGDGQADARQLVKRIWMGFALPGLLISTVSGIAQISIGGGFERYMHEGWFHTKLTFIVLLLVVTLLTHFAVKRVSNGGSLTKGRVIALHAMSSTLLLAIVFITMLGRN